jgi:hypothetical protein
MKTIKVQKALILVSIAAGVLAAGCELIVEFERTRIPVENIDSGGLIVAATVGVGAAVDAGNNPADTGADAPAEEDAGDAGTADAADAADAHDQ